MRFVLVIAIWTVIVGGLWSYISYRDTLRQQVTAGAPVDLSIEGQFTIEITPTFSTEQDPFALTTSPDPAPPIELKLNGIPIRLGVQEVVRGQTIRNEDVTGVLIGHNEIYISATPPLAENSFEHGIRIKLYEDNTLLVDRTVWAEQGALVTGTVSFNHLRKEEAPHDS